MSYEISAGCNIVDFKTGATVNANRFVKPDSTAETVIQSSAEGSLTLGVALETKAAGKRVPVQTNGVAQVDFAGTVAAWGPVESDADGKAVAAAGAAAATLGYAIEGGAAGEVRPVLLCTPVALGPANS